MPKIVYQIIIDYCCFAEKGLMLEFEQFISLWLEAQALTKTALAIGYEIGGRPSAAGRGVIGP